MFGLGAGGGCWDAPPTPGDAASPRGCVCRAPAALSSVCCAWEGGCIPFRGSACAALASAARVLRAGGVMGVEAWEGVRWERTGLGGC